MRRSWDFNHPLAALEPKRGHLGRKWAWEGRGWESFNVPREAGYKNWNLSFCFTCNLKRGRQDFHGGPVVKNLPCNAGDEGSVPGQITKILPTEEQIGRAHV